VKTLVLGSGGRESALAWALNRSSEVTEIVVAPGNPGIASFASCIGVDPNSTTEVVALARRLSPALVVVGPEAPLVQGAADALRAEGCLVFGPDSGAARIEGSKAYAKELMESAGIATARAFTCAHVPEAIAALDELGPPYVVKADGLAAGKGVVVTGSRTEAVGAIEDRMLHGKFGEAGRRVIVEEFLDGEEVSLIAFSDGQSVVPCEPAQDYKRVFDGDAGPNTGGMGSYSPVPACPPPVAEQVVGEVIEPMVRATAARGAPFAGALYAGLALTGTVPKVIEFNVRFGDPETQALIPRLRSDLAEALMACATASLAGVKLEWSPQACVALVLASGGYPGRYETGFSIAGLEEAAARKNVTLFHAGTRAGHEGIVTDGGRVLAISALGDSFAAARRRANATAEIISFEGMHFRNDIALRAELMEKGEKE
jgi:phosphoribosylamine---glycine ligase